LSDRVLAIPELPDDSRMLFAAQGFNVIATANTRDRGVNEMSAALKRRFNFETVLPISSVKQEMELVKRETDKMFERTNVPVQLPLDATEVIVTTFHELRQGKTADGQSLEQPSTVMSTAEAISTAYAAGVHAYYYADGNIQAEHIVNSMMGTAFKDSTEDQKKIHHYFNHAVKGRKGKIWQAFYEARKLLP
jgi:hypothetical protein